MVLGVVEDDPAVRVIHAVVYVVRKLADARRLANDLRHRRGRRGHRKRPGSTRISIGTGKDGPVRR